MTEELKQKAEEYALEKCKECYMCNSEENGERGYCPKYESRKEGYIAGATEATKELQEENERLKKGGCCLVNCNGRENGIELRKAKIKIEQLEKQIEKMKSDVREMAEQADKNGDMLALKRMSELFEKWKLTKE